MRYSKFIFVGLFGIMTSRLALGGGLNLLTWWDYLDPKVVNRLKKDFGDFSIRTYRNNLEAIGVISNPDNKIDIAIISNIVKPVVIDSIDAESSRKVWRGRSYLKFFDKDCIPYFWGTFIFSSKDENEVPDSLEGLIAQGKKAKPDSPRVGIFDDPFEVYTRLRIDQGGPVNYDDVQTSRKDNLFSANMFLSDTAILYQEGGGFAYGWHGEAAKVAGESGDKTRFKFSLGKKKAVIGLDMVCILKGGRQKQKIAFAAALTDRTSTEINMKMNQSFSPYTQHTPGLNDFSLEVYRQLMERIGKGNFHMTATPSSKQQNKVNTWWEKVRYVQ